VESCSVAVACVRTQQCHGRVQEYKPLLRKARWILRDHNDVMLLADRGLPTMTSVGYKPVIGIIALRLPSDAVTVSDAIDCRRLLYPKLRSNVFSCNVGLWQDGHHRLVLASPQGVKEPWQSSPMSLYLADFVAIRLRFRVC